MPTIPTSATGAYTPTSPLPVPKEQTDLFSSDGFLKILSSQIRSQNPLEPMKDTEFIAQMAQFSTVSGLQQSNTTLAAIAAKLDQLIAATTSVTPAKE